MTHTKLNESSYMYRKLKEMFPKEKEFFSYYSSGDYYNTAQTIYYDAGDNEIYRENHGHYG